MIYGSGKSGKLTRSRRFESGLACRGLSIPVSVEANNGETLGQRAAEGVSITRVGT